MSTVDFGVLDYLGGFIEKRRDELGPFYGPARTIFGALIFLILLYAMVCLPFFLLSGALQIVMAQILLVTFYFIALLALQQNVFDRAAFCTVLVIVVAAAPKFVSAQLLFDRMQRDNAGLAVLAELEFPIFSVFLLSFARGLLNVAWAIPLLFYYFTFYPSLSEGGEEKLDRVRDRTLVAGAALQLAASAYVAWRNGLFTRSFASTESALPYLQEVIERHQMAFLVSTLVYLLAGFVALAIWWKWPRRRDSKVLLLAVAGMVFCQLAYSIATRTTSELNRLYPAALTSAGVMQAYESRDGEDVIFVSSIYRLALRGPLDEYQIYYACRHPRSGRFSYAISSLGELDQRYSPVMLGLLRDDSPEKLFCQEE